VSADDGDEDEGVADGPVDDGHGTDDGPQTAGGTRGIAAAGVYTPRARLSSQAVREAWGTVDARGIDTTAVPAGDEDALTMGVAAARRALDNGPVRAEAVTTVAFATTTPPLAEGGLVPRLCRALGTSTDVRGYHHAGTTAAGADALETALAADGPALAVVTDAPVGDLASEDHAMGAGAAAFVVDADAPVELVARAAATDESPGIRFRSDAETTSLGVKGYERSVTRRLVGRALGGLDLDLTTVTAAALHQPNGSLPFRIADDLPPETVERGLVVDRIGDAGAATVPVGLVAALETGSNAIAAFFGSGSNAVALAFEGGLDSNETEGIDSGIEVGYVDALRMRGRLGEGRVEGGGAHVSMPTWRRSLDARYLHTAGRCSACGALSFPGRGACDACHERVDVARVTLARVGRVVARTVIGHGGAPPEFVDHQRREGAYGAALVRVKAADGDGSVVVPAQLTDCDPTAVGVGDRVRAVVRRIDTQEGIPRYGAKFVPDT
jgi:hypothetical protein